jgi:putative ABC transport system ATP-binding protein
MNNNDNIIIAEAITKDYKDHDVVVNALRGVNLVIKAGEFTSIAGPSGSGKTTLLNIISGLDIPSRGQVLLKGQKITCMSGNELSDFRRDNVGFIFQAYNLIPVLTVEENIEYIMMLQGINKTERHERVQHMLEELELKGFHNRFPYQLSGGQQQRVAIARAMVSKPSLILADEPTANLDSKTSGALLDMMRELNMKTGMTFLFSTHDEMVKARAKRLVILKDGIIEKDEYRN